jgi:hypothetical protein
MAMATPLQWSRTTPALGSMPSELLDAIASNLEHTRDVSKFRSICKHFAQVGQRWLFYELAVIMDPDSLRKLDWISLNQRPKPEWFNGADISQFVKRVVFEEVMPSRLAEFSSLGMHGSWGTYTAQYKAWVDLRVLYVESADVRENLEEILKRFSHLTGMEACYGFKHDRFPAPGAKEHLEEILEYGYNCSQEEFEELMWDSRWTNQIFIPPPANEWVWIQAFHELFHSVSKKILHRSSNQQFNSLSRTTQNRIALPRGLRGNSIPRDKIRSAKLHYVGNNQYDSWQFEHDALVLASPRSGFGFITNLSLGGKSMGGFGLLNLDVIANLQPAWPSLKVVSLANVEISEGVVRWLLWRAITISFYNAHFWGRGIDLFKNGSRFISANFTGILGQRRGITKNTKVTDGDELWIAAESHEAALLVAQGYRPEMPSGSWKSPDQDHFVTPLEMRRYVVGGGSNPLVESTRWLRTELEDWS